MNNDVNVKSGSSIWKALLRKWFIVVIIAAICAGIAVAYSAIKIKPVYTASTSIVLKMTISDDNNTSTNTNNATLAKKNLPTVKEIIESYSVAEKANEFYNQANSKEGNNVSYGAINVSYGEKSMIFTLSYTDLSKENAGAKLKAVIETAPAILETRIEAETVDLVPVQNTYSYSSSDRTSTVIIMGVLIGLVLGVGVVLVMYLLDNKVSSREELEQITGANVLAYIEND